MLFVYRSNRGNRSSATADGSCLAVEDIQAILLLCMNHFCLNEVYLRPSTGFKMSIFSYSSESPIALLIANIGNTQQRNYHR